MCALPLARVNCRVHFQFSIKLAACDFFYDFTSAELLKRSISEFRGDVTRRHFAYISSALIKDEITILSL